MDSVLTLVGKADTSPLEAALVNAARQALTEAGANVSAPDWLAPNLACDIAFEGVDLLLAEATIRATGMARSIDFLAQPKAGRAKKLLIADMDSTMITVECLDELADFAGRKEEVSAITERAMRGELDFEGALTERVAMLTGLDESALAQTYEERVHLMPGGLELVRTMKANGALCILVSGGFTYFTSRVAKELGFAEHRGNELIISQGKLSGEVGLPILGRDAKRASLNAARLRLGLEAFDTLAVGDGANDLDMLSDAGLGVAYHAKPIVAEAARARVDHGDLTTLLYFQGYRRSEFRTD